MKRFFMSTGLLLLAFGSKTFAQIGFAPEIGLNMSSISGIDEIAPDAKGIIGLRAGVVVDFHLSDKVHLQPGIFFSSQGSKLDEEESVHISYIQIPVNVFYHFNLGAGSIFAGGGPFLGYAASGVNKGDGESESLDIGNADDDDIKPMDGGIDLTAGFQSSMGIYVKLGYFLGFMNFANGASDLDFKNRTAFVAIGYMLGGH